ncbi:cell surface protein [Nannocystaceae bacterium ST9]
MSESRSIRRAAALVFAFVGSSLACSEPEPSSDPFADEVVAFEPAEGSYFGHERMPEVVLGGPGGSLDVASLGCEGEIVVRFDEPGIVDGPGVDLIVFENPFAESFPEPGEVSVSEDGETWWVFACDPESGQGCAGVTPTGALGNPTDPDRAGGDGFDLATLAEGPAQVWFVRVRDRSREHWQPLGMNWCDPGQAGSGGFDLDALAAVHG